MQDRRARDGVSVCLERSVTSRCCAVGFGTSSEATRSTSVEQCLAVGLPGLVCSPAQAKPDRTSRALYCQTVPVVPEIRPT